MFALSRRRGSRRHSIATLAIYSPPHPFAIQKVLVFDDNELMLMGPRLSRAFPRVSKMSFSGPSNDLNI